MPVNLRLSTADRKRLGAPTDLVFDRAALDAIPSNISMPWEEQLPKSTSIYQICVLEWPRFTVLGMRGVAWLAWQMTEGTDAPDWDKFDISTTGLRFTITKDADAGPPADGPSDMSPEADASEMASA